MSNKLGANCMTIRRPSPTGYFSGRTTRPSPFSLAGKANRGNNPRVATDPDRLKRYLTCEALDKKWVSDKLVYLLSGEAIIPPFSAAAIKLGQLSRMKIARWRMWPR